MASIQTETVKLGDGSFLYWCSYGNEMVYTDVFNLVVDRKGHE